MTAESISGAVSALIVGVAPAAVRESDLLNREVGGWPIFAWPLRALAELDVPLTGVVILLPERSPATDFRASEISDVMARVAHGHGDDWAEGLALAPDSEWIILLDAQLPLVSAASLRVALGAAGRTGIAIASEPVKETLKLTRGAVVIDTPARGSLVRLQTPLIVRRDLLQRAVALHRKGDDLVTLVQRAGAPIVAVDAGYPCVRVTSEDDLAIVETLLRQRQSEAHPS